MTDSTMVALRPDQVRRLLIMAAEPKVGRVSVGNASTTTRELVDDVLARLASVGVTLSATLTVTAKDDGRDG